MPPEALDEEDPVYGTPVDVFSFGGVALHLFSEEWPTPSGPKKQDPTTKKLVALTEAQWRQQYLDTMAVEGAALKEMVMKCLDDDPIQEVTIVPLTIVPLTIVPNTRSVSQNIDN